MSRTAVRLAEALSLAQLGFEPTFHKSPAVAKSRADSVKVQRINVCAEPSLCITMLEHRAVLVGGVHRFIAARR
jgi:hypothetical protein